MDVAAVRAALWLPEDIHQPPDMAVPLVVSDDMLAEWVREDASGSADAAYALGVRLMQGGDLEQAKEHFTRAAQRGSAAGAYARFRAAEVLGSTPEEILDLLRAADEAGSAGAAYNVGEEHLRHGDLDAAAAAFKRATDRARAGDAAGSADAARSWPPSNPISPGDAPLTTVPTPVDPATPPPRLPPPRNSKVTSMRPCRHTCARPAAGNSRLGCASATSWRPPVVGPTPG